MIDASIWGMHPAFMSDALADLADAGDPWADPAPAPLTLAQQQVCLGAALFAMDSETLRAADPGLWLLRGQFIAQSNAAFAKGASLTGAYQAAPGARNAMRSDLHAAGVI